MGKSIGLTLLFISSLAVSQTRDTVTTSDRPNDGRTKWNRWLNAVTDTLATHRGTLSAHADSIAALRSDIGGAGTDQPARDTAAAARDTTVTLRSNITTILSAQNLVADTTALKALTNAAPGEYRYLEELSSGAGVGGGWFFVADSTYPEGVVAFGSATAGKQWVREEYKQTKRINVQWAGARGNGLVDDIIPITNALAALPTRGGQVYFPTGDYKVTSPVEVTVSGFNKTVVLRGDGEASRIFPKGSIGGIHVRDGAANGIVHISDLAVDADSATNMTYGIKLDTLSNGSIRGVSVIGRSKTDVAIYLNHHVSMNINACYVNGSDTGVYILGSSGSNPSNIMINGNQFAGTGSNGIGIYSKASAEQTIYGNQIGAYHVSVFVDTLDTGGLTNIYWNHFEVHDTSVVIRAGSSDIASNSFVGGEGIVLYNLAGGTRSHWIHNNTISGKVRIRPSIVKALIGHNLFADTVFDAGTNTQWLPNQNFTITGTGTGREAVVMDSVWARSAAVFGGTTKFTLAESAPYSSSTGTEGHIVVDKGGFKIHVGDQWKWARASVWQTPKDVTGLKSWLFPETFDWNGDQYYVWYDSSGTNHNFAVDTTGNTPPDVVDNVANSYPVLRFDGTPPTFGPSGASMITSRNFTLSVVAKTSASNEYIFSRGTGTWEPQIRLGSGGANKMGYVDTTGAAYESDALTYPRTQFNIYTWKKSGTTVSYYQNGQAMGTSTVPDNLFYFGVMFYPAAITGDVAEMCIYDTALTDDDRAVVEQYLNSKYDIITQLIGDASNVNGKTQTDALQVRDFTNVGYKLVVGDSDGNITTIPDTATGGSSGDTTFSIGKVGQTLLTDSLLVEDSTGIKIVQSISPNQLTFYEDTVTSNYYTKAVVGTLVGAKADSGTVLYWADTTLANGVVTQSDLSTAVGARADSGTALYWADTTLSNGVATNYDVSLKANSSVTLTAGDGLQGGGDLSTNRTFTASPKATGGLVNTADSLAVDSTKFPATDYDVSLKFSTASASVNQADSNQLLIQHRVTDVGGATQDTIKGAVIGDGLAFDGDTLSATGGVSDGDKGDITTSSSGTVWTVDASGKAAILASPTITGTTTLNTSLTGTLVASSGVVSAISPTMTINLAIPVLAALTWTNMPSALSFWMGTATVGKSITKADLSNFDSVRIHVNKQGTAGAASSKVIFRYLTTFTQTASSWLDIGTSEVSVATNNTNTFTTTSWIPLAAGAKADVFITLMGSGGDGTLDPAFGMILAEFK